MLTISNKIGLMAAVNAAGYHVDQRDGVLIGIRSADGATGADINDAIMAIDAAYPLSAAADVVCAAIRALAAAKRDRACEGESKWEAAAWPIKRAEAIAYQASGNAADAPFLSDEAADGGISLASLVAKVLSDATRFAALESAIAGRKRWHTNAVRALATHADIVTYDYTTGWPL